MKKIFSAIISSPLKGRLGGVLFALLATTSLWAYDFQHRDLYYNITSFMTVEVTSKSPNSPYNEGVSFVEITIPDSVIYEGNTYYVTDIGKYAFSDCATLKTITIPNSIINIGKYAFRNCTTLTTIKIGNNVKTIADGAFQNCTILSSIRPILSVSYPTIPNSVITIGSSAFKNCTGLTSITIGNGVQEIGSSAFYGCSSLKSVTVGTSVKEISDNIFTGCSSLTSITIPNSVTSIGGSAFSGCSGLTSVTIGNSVTSIGGSTFYGCSSLTSITIPNSVTKIGDSAFSGCSGLTSATISNSVTSIGDYTFKDCSSLTSITIPNSVTSIGGSAFSGCSGLTSVTIGNSVTSIGKGAFSNCSSLISVTIGNRVTNIGSSAFYNCSSLTSVTIPNSVTSIGDNAFEYCYGLTKTNYTGNVASWCKIKFGNYDANPIYYSRNFYINDQEIKDLVVPNIVDTIHNYAFCNCRSLKSVTIGNSVTNIGSSAFSKCSSLTSVIWNAENYADFSSYAAAPFYNVNKTITSFTFGDNVRHIPTYLCYYMNQLTSITIPHSVTSIGEGAFYNCSSLTKTNYTGDVTSWCKINFGSYAANPIYYSRNFYINDQEIKDLVIPNTVDKIPNSAFENCSSLTSVTIGNSVTSIGYNAFDDCSSLTSVTIPNSVTSIGDNAFEYCYGLTKTNYTGNVASWCKIKFGNYDANPIYYSRNFYINDQEIKDLVVPNIVDTIHNYAFCNCRSLKSITIPNGVKSIGDDAFYGCYSLISITIDDENVVYDSRNNCNAIIETANNTLIRGCQNTLIPNGITKILNNAFSWDIHMDTIYVEATIPPILGDESDDDFEFPGSYESICIIPYGTLEAYQSSSWANYVNYFIEQVGTRDSDIKWIMNGGSVADTLPTSLTASYKLSNTPTREGYGFIGWYDNPEGRGLALTILPAGYKGTLYAIWVGATLNSCGDHCYWRYLDNILTITGTGAMYDYTPSNPTPWDNYRRSDIHTISLSEGLTSIGGWAFGECESITSITIPNSVTNIGDKAFWGCRKLDSIVVPNSVIHIGERAFYSCVRLTSITLPDNLTSIEKYLLGYCSSLVSVVIPENVTTIGEMALAYCSSLSAITIPETVNYVEWGAFYGSNDIDSVIVEATTPPAIGERGLIFSSSPTCYIPCGTLAAYQSSSWAEQVGSFVEQCDEPVVDANKCGDNLYWAYTDGTLTITGTGDMYNYDYMDNLAPWNSVSNNIKNIVLPEGLTSIGEWAFYLCASVTSISIPEGVSSIGVRAFCNCSSLTSISIPNSVTSVGERAFYNCYNLASVTLSTNLSKIDKYLFGQCRTLTAITIPNNVTAIENGAFSGCSSLDSVSIEATTPPVLSGSSTFSSSPTCYIPCGTLAAYQSSSWAEQVGSFIEQCNDNENNQSLISVTDATLSDWDNLPAEYVSSCVHQKDASLDGLKSMKVYADERHINLLVEYKPETITSLEWTNFRIYINTDNSDLTGGYGASWSDANTDILLETAVFASGKPNPYNPAVYKWWGEVGDNSWDGWYNPTIELTQENCWGAIICEGSTPAVGNSQVIGNYIEIQIDYKRIPADWNKNQFTLGVEIDQNWDIAGLLPNASNGELGSTVLAEKLLVNVHPINAPILIDGILYEITSNEEPLTAEVYACTDYTIAEVDIPASITHEGQIYDVTSIGNGAFSACTRLTSITIPNSVMSIGDAAFFACFGLTEVTIPNSVTSIGELAFYNCRSLASVTLEATTPPVLSGSSTFSSSPVCYIPCGTLAVYQSSSWAEQVGGFVEQCDDNDNNQSLISVTDGTLSDWDYLPMEYLFETKCVEGASLDALKSVKVYADLTYINLVVEWDTEIVTDLTSVPFHVYLNVDNDAPTGGFGDQWVKPNIDLLLEGYFYLDSNPCAYQPDVALYAGTPLANEWAWDWTTIEALAASQLITKGVMEIQIEYGKLPVKLENTFTVGFDIQQSWSSVGVLPNAANDNSGNRVLAEKMLVRINNVNAPTSIENTHSPSSITNTQKLLRNGQLIILHDGKTYTVMGAEIK